MRKSILVLMFALIAPACGGYDDRIEYDDNGNPSVVDSVSEYGQVMAALTVPDRYGIRTPVDGDSRCTTTSNPCAIPKDKVLSFRVDWQHVEDSTWWLWPGAEDEWFEGITNGFIEAASMAGPGWIVDMAGTQTSESVVFPNSTPVEPWGRAAGSSITSKTVNGRNFSLVGRCKLELYQHNFTWGRAELNMDRDETIAMIAHTVKHELGHCLGLGHEPNPINVMTGSYGAGFAMEGRPYTSSHQSRVRGYVL